MIFQRLLGFDPKKHNLRTEIVAGLTTFLTMAYILAVNPAILGSTGMDKGALFTTTVISSVFATLLMAVYAKLPFVLAPGMGLNAFFAYTVCQTLGYSWQFALTAVFVEGLIVIFLTITNIREKIVYLLPKVLRDSIGIGIGLYIAFIGLQNAGIIVKNDSTLVSLGDVTSGSAMLGMTGLIITSILLIRQVKGALLYGILITALLGVPLGLTDVKSVISMPPSIEPIFLQIEWENIFSTEMLLVLSTFLFVDLFGTMGTLIGVASKAGMVQEDGKIPRLNRAFMVDAVGTTAGALLGTCTVTTFVESAAGVGEGGRTGVTAFSAAVCFLLALSLSPFFLAIPAAATAPVLILVGLMMISSIINIDFSDYSESIPAFICIIFTPLTYSISDGIVLGMISYVLINLLSGKTEKVTIPMCLLAAVFALKFFI